VAPGPNVGSERPSVFENHLRASIVEGTEWTGSLRGGREKHGRFTVRRLQPVEGVWLHSYWLRYGARHHHEVPPSRQWAGIASISHALSNTCQILNTTVLSGGATRHTGWGSCPTYRWSRPSPLPLPWRHGVPGDRRSVCLQAGGRRRSFWAAGSRVAHLV